MIEKILRKEIKVAPAARALGKSRQILHRWIKTYQELGPEGLFPQKPGPKEGSPINRTSQDKEDIILELSRLYPFEGPIPLSRHYEQRTGERLHPTTIFRILKRRGSRYSRPSMIFKHKPKLYTKTFPGEEIQMDNKYPFGRAKKVSIFTCIDDHSRWPEAKVYDRRTEENAIDFLRYLVCRAPYKILCIRTDRGREFGTRFSEVCKEMGIQHIRNRGYRPEDNGKIERWHRTLQEDLIWPYFKLEASHEEYQYHLTHYLFNFRFKRPHTGLGMNSKTPAEKLILHYLNPTHESVNLILQQNKS